MNIEFKACHVTLIVTPTDLRGSFRRLCSIAEGELGIQISSGKEIVVFLSKSRKLCKIITCDDKGSLLIARYLSQGCFEQIMLKTDQQAKMTLSVRELEKLLNGERIFVVRKSYWK